MDTRVLANILNVGLELLFPANCYGCGRGGRYLCKVCAKHKLRHIYQSVCCICGLECWKGGIHAGCRQYSCLHDCYSVCRSCPALDRMLHDGKYKFYYQIYKDLGRLLAVKSLEWDLGDQMVTWVPQSSYRSKWRGFNQVEILAREFARLTGRVCIDVFERMHNPANQVGLTREQRLLNLRGQIAVRGEVAGEIRGRALIIVDDVFTTGATLQECAKVAELVGAKSTCGLTLLLA